MKTYLRIIVLCGLLILSYISISGNAFKYTQVVANQNSLVNTSSFHELSDSNKSYKSLGGTTKRYRSDYTSNVDYSAIEINEQLTYHNSGINNSRLRKGVDISDILKGAIQRMLFRDRVLVQDKSKTFHSSTNHRVLPPCQYYVFALRRIII